MIHILNQDDEIIDYFDINDGTVLEPNLIRNVESLEDTLEFSVATNRSINVQDRNRVIIKDNEGEYREFIIMQYESNLDGFTDVSCVGSHLEDFQTAKPYKTQKLERYTTKEALSFMAADTGWEVAPDNEWNGLRTTSWSSWKDRLSLLKQLQTTYDMRLSFYVELGTNTVKHRYVKLVEVNPMFNGEEIVYGENMIDLKRTVDFTDVATALIAIGPEDNDGNRLIIEEVDDAAQNQLGLPYRYLWQIYEPESDDQNMTEARLRTLARTKLNKIKSASVEYEIKSTQLNVKAGDMIRVKNEDFTPELYVEAEVIEIKYNAYSKLCDYKFGILTEYTRAEVYERFNALLETLRERLNNVKYDTENVINERLEEELAGLERYIEKSPLPPLDPQEGDLWLDTSHNKVAVLKRYENGEWVKSSVTEAHEVNAPTKEEALYTMLQERKNRLNNDFISNYGLFNTLTAHKHYDELPAEIKNMLYDLFVDQTNKYSAFESDFDYINAEQPTIGLILAAMESALRFEDSSNKFKTGYNTARVALDDYLEILRSQYTDEKYNDALNAVADKFGFDVVDGKLLGDANFIENMEEIKTELQQQLDDAKKAFDELEIGGRNLLAYSTEGMISEFGDQIYFGTDSETNIPAEVKSITLSIWNPLHVGVHNIGGMLIYEDSENTMASDEINIEKFPKSKTFKPSVENTDITGVLFVVDDVTLEQFKDIKFKLEIGTVASQWTPAPEDTDNKITNINHSITNIEGQLKSTVNKDTFDLLNETVTKQGTTIEQTADSLSSKADKSVVDTLSGTVNKHGTQLTQTAEELASKADKTLLDEANDKITQQGTLINQNAQDISLRAKTDDLNTVTGRVEKAESDIKINAGEISSRVKDVDYQTDKDGIINRLSGAESSITQQSKLIETKVSSTELTQAIDDIEVGGRNLLEGSADINRSWETEVSRYKYLLRPHIQSIVPKVKVGDTLTFSLDIEAEARTPIRIYDSNGNPSMSFGNHSFIVEEGIHRISFTTTLKESSSNSSVWFMDVYNSNNEVKFSISKIKIEKGNKATDWTPAPEDVDEKIKENENRIIKHDTKFEQTDTQLSLKATMTDVNQSDETLSQAISELVIDSTNGLKFNYDSNGRLASYSVGRDGIQFDGSKIKFTASDSIMLQINAAKKAGDDAKAQADAARNGNNIAASLNLSGTTTKISGSKIELVGDVDMVNGNTRIKNLNLNHATVTGGTGKNTININNNEIISHGLFTRTWAGETDTAELNLGIRHGRIMISNENTGYNIYLTEKGLSTTMAGATAGLSSGTLEFHSQRFNETSRGVTLHSTFGTAALVSDESTVVTRSRLTNNIESDEYSVYIRPTRLSRSGLNEFAFYVKANESPQDTDGTLLFGDLTGDNTSGSGIRFSKRRNLNTVYITNINGDIGTGDISVKDAEVRGSIRTIGGLDVRTWDGTGYNQLRAGALNTYNSLILASHSGGNAYLGVGGYELRVTNNNGYNGGSTTYRDARISTLHTHGGFQNHSGAGFVYFGVGGAAGMRITNNNLYNGGNIGWRDIEFRNWKSNSHEKYKKDIKEWDTNVLDIFKNELQLYQYKYKDNLENNMIHRGIVLREDSTQDKFPAEWRQDDGFNGNEVMWWTVKGLQELAQDNYNKDEIIKEQGAEIEELKKQMSEVMQLLNNK